MRFLIDECLTVQLIGVRPGVPEPASWAVMMIDRLGRSEPRTALFCGRRLCGAGLNMEKISKSGGDNDLGSTSTALPGRKLATSSEPRVLKPFEIDLLRQDLKAAISFVRHARSKANSSGTLS